MDVELLCLAGAVILALVQIVAAGADRTRAVGLAWNMGPRDVPPPPPGPVGARLLRAQANLFETLPLFLALDLAARLLHPNTALGAAGALAWLLARILYVPLYAAGVPFWRSLAWIASLLALLALLAAALGA